MSSSTPTARRVDPRRPALVTPAGLRRIVLGSEAGSRDAARLTTGASTAKPLRLRDAQAPGGCWLVIAHSERGGLDEHAREVIAAAALLAAPDQAVRLLVLGDCTEDVAAFGVDQADGLPLDGAPSIEAVLATVQAHCQALAPRHTLLADRGADGELGRRLAVAQGLSLAASVVEIQPHAGAPRLRVRHHGAPGVAAADATAPLTDVLLLARQVARTALPFVGLGGRTTLAPVTPRAVSGLTDLGTHAGQAEQVALEEADFIVAAGNGVTDVALFRRLAAALGGAVGASRVAVDDGRFARSQQIGASGKTVQARGYLAFGISGAVQHLQGIRECRHVIAVNTDAATPMTQRAELTVVADAQPLMRALLALVEDTPRPGDAP